MQFFMIDTATAFTNAANVYAPAAIEAAAQAILQSGGLLKPIIAVKRGLEKYEVIANHFEFFSAQRAQEIDPIKGEMVNALVLQPAEVETALVQLNILNPR